MKYLGEKSLSSVLEKVLHVSWFAVLIGSIFIAFFLSIILFGPDENPPTSELGIVKSKIYEEMNKEDDKDWQELQEVPEEGKIVILPYLSVLVVLLLIIIRKGRDIFKNFKNNQVFHESNVIILLKISKLLIWFSILTFNFPSLLVSIILLILTDVFKNGTALQQEHDLTV